MKLNKHGLAPYRTFVACAAIAAVGLSQVACTTGGYGAVGAHDEEAFGPDAMDDVGFADVDADGDGLASWPDIVAKYEDEFSSVGWDNPDALVAFDKDNDGFFDRAEFDGIINGLLEHDNRRQSSHSNNGEGYFSFDDADKNKDGLVQQTELSDDTVTEGLQYRLYDDNEDGALDREEFREYLSSRSTGE